MAVALQHFIENLDLYVSSRVVAESAYIHNLQSVLIQNTLNTARLALFESFPNEIYTFSGKQLMAKRVKNINNNSIQCGINNEYVTIPNVFNSDTIYIDCCFLKLNGSISV